MKALVDNSFRLHQTALNLQAYRQQVIASNIANADTPNYKARDIDFRAALQGAMQASAAGAVRMNATHPAHVAAAAANPFETHTGFRTELQSAVDGNTVNMDVERAAFAENAIRYEASVTFISGMLRSLNTAISGQ